MHTTRQPWPTAARVHSSSFYLLPWVVLIHLFARVGIKALKAKNMLAQLDASDLALTNGGKGSFLLFPWVVLIQRFARVGIKALKAKNMLAQLDASPLR